MLKIIVKKDNAKILNIFFAGLIAITLNTLLLKAAPIFNIVAESGGLLKLILLSTHLYMSAAVLAYVHTTAFWVLFHYLTGFAMVILYVYIFQPLLPGKGWQKGSLFSLLPWMINGFIVLPLLGQGLIGIHQLPVTGIIYFFVANWIFGITLGVLYERFTKRNNYKIL